MSRSNKFSAFQKTISASIALAQSQTTPAAPSTQPENVRSQRDRTRTERGGLYGALNIIYIRHPHCN
ncbi:hypothetical protein M422DRAFT_31555 [Sphaerobolus stellatus SS14]|uniref:Unplaced genomic scaffold SPHSTscaffold_58, whole genome shotgun sequence n=1 Tax=Sphaerobolus stellatus (strain SS14) TaxID=990650 RepID=A0A0C9VUJ5_SPHS4|nr:hypothetical protein M422DRAFT_31555 [Sphaerobolus stellatus SS14]